MASLLVSAAHKSSGKTTLSIGLCATLRALGHTVQPFKKGPDYIDPAWLGQACGRACHNLDPYLMDAAQILSLFAQSQAGAGISLVEGNKGLYDGVALDGSNSNAALAHLLGLPVVLVIDARGMTRGLAPLLLGYQAFDRNIRIAGVILNRVGGSRHAAKLRAAAEHYTDIPVLGCVAEDASLALTERHLGLIPGNEHPHSQRLIAHIGQRVAEQVDMPALLRAIGAGTPAAAQTPGPGPARAAGVAQAGRPPHAGVRVGIARDRAFGFYYEDDLQALRHAGADLVAFDTLHDAALPEGLHALFIGGGFPEVFMQELQANASLRSQIGQAIARGLPAYAECGGLMYLSRSLTWRDQRCDMVGAIGADIVLNDKPVGRGYVGLEATPDMPWPGLRGQSVRGHEFHYSSVHNLDANTRFAWRVTRGHGIDGRHDGIVQARLLASYAHLRSLAGTDWARHFVAFVRSCQSPAVAHSPALAEDLSG